MKKTENACKAPSVNKQFCEAKTTGVAALWAAGFLAAHH